MKWSEWKSLSHVRFFATPWTGACQALSVHGILQARILEWVAISFSRGSSQPKDQTQVSQIISVLYGLSHQGSPRILEWVAYLFSRGYSRPRTWTAFSTACRFFTNWASREAPFAYIYSQIWGSVYTVVPDRQFSHHSNKISLKILTFDFTKVCRLPQISLR